MEQIGAILLAAGLSNRMQGPNKLLLPFRGSTVVRETYNSLSASKVMKTIIVTGRDASSIKDQIDLINTDQICHNSVFSEGMTSSIQTGLELLNSFDAVMICLGDMPILTSEDYNLLINTFEQKCDVNSILVPWFRDQRANPAIFGSDYFDDILNHTQPNGCSGIIKQNAKKVLNLNVDNERFITDLDTPKDYEKLNKN